MIRLQRQNAADSFVEVLPERGGIITKYVVKGKSILYMDDEMGVDSPIIRGGMPILFPVCGRLNYGKYILHGEERTMPQHGFIRDLSWQMDGDLVQTFEESSVHLTISDSDQSRKFYPFSFRVFLTYTLREHSLEITTNIKNLSNENMPFQLGFHPYFYVSDKEKFSCGLESDGCFDGVMGVVNYGQIEQILKYKLKDEVTNLCYYNVKSGPEFYTGDWRIKLELDSELKTIVLWSLKGKSFVCVEPWSGLPGDFDRGTMRWLKPGSEFCTGFVIRVEL